MTSVHNWSDSRILRKECTTLARAGFDVHLVATNCAEQTHDCVKLVSVPQRGGRIRRMTSVAFKVFRATRAVDADIVHVHDPELLPWALLLRANGKKVIYDIHEDYSISLLHAPYLPRLSRGIVSRLCNGLEFVARHLLETIIAENSYVARFPDSYRLLNYPNRDLVADVSFDDSRTLPATPRVLYAGSITESRGALIHAALVNSMDGLFLHNVGKCPPNLAARMLRTVSDPSKISLDVEEMHVPFERILDAYRQPWTAALSLFPDMRPDYKDKQLTKFFEYMAAGIPIVCSDFPAWRELVEENGVGICVDPHDLDAAAEAISRIHGDRELFAAMSQRGRHLIREKFNWENEEQRFLEFYDRVAAES